MTEPAIVYDNVSFAYPGSEGGEAAAEVLSNVSLTVVQGERLGIVGPNGGGKTTLLKLTLGLLPVQRGSVRVMGRSPIAARRAGVIGYVPQRVQAEMSFPLSVHQVASMGLWRGISPWRGLSAAHRARVDEVLGLVGMSALADRPIGRLSGGQAQRVMIARALVGPVRILLLDEPTVGVDVVGQTKLAEVLAAVHRSMGVAIVMVSHDLRSVAESCDRVACLRRTLHSHGSAHGLTPGVLAEVFQHEMAGIFGDVHVDAHAASECSQRHHERLSALARRGRSVDGGEGTGA